MKAMSADSWRTCPQCLLRAQAAHGEADKKAAAAYGNVSAGEYEAFRVEAAKRVKLDETLSAYYELGIDNTGEFYVDYSGECQVCGFKHAFKYTEQLTLTEA